MGASINLKVSCSTTKKSSTKTLVGWQFMRGTALRKSI